MDPELGHKIGVLRRISSCNDQLTRHERHVFIDFLGFVRKRQTREICSLRYYVKPSEGLKSDTRFGLPTTPSKKNLQVNRLTQHLFLVTLCR